MVEDKRPCAISLQWVKVEPDVSVVKINLRIDRDSFDDDLAMVSEPKTVRVLFLNDNVESVSAATVPVGVRQPTERACQVVVSHKLRVREALGALDVDLRLIIALRID